MSPRLALELTPSELRGIVASGWRDTVLRTVAVPWSPEAPDAGIAALRDIVGPVDSIAVTIGLGFLQIARVNLPPAPDEARERMLALEGGRYFAIESPVVAAIAPGGKVALAADAVRLERWCALLERWGPVTRVDSAPVALARALKRTAGSERYLLEANDGEQGVLELRDSLIESVRRIPLATGEEVGQAIPGDTTIPASHRAAWGTLLAEDASSVGTLATPERRRRFAVRRRRRLVVAALAAVAALVLAYTAVDRWRDRTWQALEADVAARRDAAQAGVAALATNAQLVAEVTYLDKATRALGDGRGGVLGALAAISNAFPEDAVILNARAVGREWQVDGTAASAAALVPHLDADGQFEDVRILSASSRFRDGARTRETFSLAFRVHPRP